MKLSENTISRLQSVISLDLRTSLGCTMLAREISNAMKEPISANTLKRAFGIINSTTSPSLYTLNLIARYAGYADWESFVNDKSIRTSEFGYSDMVSMLEIPTGNSIRFGYSPNRCVSMRCIGQCRFVVTESVNSKLCVDDVVSVNQVAKGHPIEILSVERGGSNLGSFTAGLHDGISFFEIYG